MTNKQELDLHEAFVKCIEVYVRHGDMKDVENALLGLKAGLKKGEA